jgi:CPA1 family monovalent cation:H+ antiporter
VPTIELVLVLLGVIAALEVLARRLDLPLPALLVAAGVAVALVPGVPRPELNPEAVFVAFVPPLLYWGAFQASLREFGRYFFTISLLAVGLVIATAAAVAAVAHALIPELTWPAAFVLGAIVSPPDAVAAIAVTRRMRIPRQVLTVLEGESLVNDATALVAYQVSVAAAVSGAFSLGGAALEFVLAAAGGVAIGVVAGMLIARVRRMVGRTPTVEATVSLLTPFIAYLPAERLGCSGVLAVVAVGLYMGRKGPRIISAQSRLQATYMWRMITFLLEGLIFLLVGLRLPLAFAHLDGHTFLDLVRTAALVSGAAIAVRLLWVFPSGAAARWLRRRLGVAPAPKPPWQSVLFTGFAGIRGGDSLVIALSLPLVTAAGAPFPGRAMIIFLTFVVIVVTLVALGLALAPIARALRLDGDGEAERRAAARAREQLDGAAPRPPETPDALAERRRALIRLWEEGAVEDADMRRLENELDLAEVLLELRPPAAPARAAAAAAAPEPRAQAEAATPLEAR